MARIPEAESRIFKNVYVCKVCKHTIRAPPLAVLAGEVPCRNCGAKKLRPKRKK